MAAALGGVGVGVGLAQPQAATMTGKRPTNSSLIGFLHPSVTDHVPQGPERSFAHWHARGKALYGVASTLMIGKLTL